jgi:hypothetical protein
MSRIPGRLRISFVCSALRVSGLVLLQGVSVPLSLFLIVIDLELASSESHSFSIHYRLWSSWCTIIRGIERVIEREVKVSFDFLLLRLHYCLVLELLLLVLFP